MSASSKGREERRENGTRQTYHRWKQRHGKFAAGFMEGRKDGMRMGKRWKKIASLMLSVAMAVTLVPTQFAYAANEDATVRPRVVSEDDGSIGSSLPEKLVYFSFDENVTDGGSAKGKAEGNGATVKADDKKVGGGALSLDGTDRKSVV